MGLPNVHVSNVEMKYIVSYFSICKNKHTSGAIHNNNINLLLTEREGRTGEYWTEHSQVHTKTTEGQNSPVRLQLARLVSSLLYSTRAMLVLNLPAAENKKYTAL